MYMSSYSQQDYYAAKQDLCAWQNKTNETADSLMLRKRKAELRQLVRTVIKNELSHEDQLIVKLHWYDGLSQSEVAQILGVDRSTVTRRIRKINEVLYDKLKYAIEFRYGKIFSEKTSLIITDCKAPEACVKADEISKRLINLRREQCFDVEDVCRLSGIPTERMEKIEKKGSVITATELKKLSVLFRVTSDYILFGKG